jgi:lactate permease
MKKFGVDFVLTSYERVCFKMIVILAILPILWLVVGLAILKMAAWKACSIAVLISFIVSVAAYGQGVGIMISAALEGVALAIWPILLVITAAIFTYNLVLHTKAMDTIKQMLTSVSNDRRVIALLLAWGFGAFMEGMAGFGTAVAIPASMMFALGFDPIKSIIVCLIANTVPTPFGSIAIPTTTMASLTGLDLSTLGIYTAYMNGILDIVCPFLVVMVIGGGPKALKGVFLVTLISGFALLIPEYIICVAVGPELAVIASSIIIMGAIVICAKIFKNDDPEYQMDSNVVPVDSSTGIKAAMPFILIFVFLLITSKLVPAINAPLSAIKTAVPIYQGIGAKPYTFVWIATPGIMIFLAAFIGGKVQGAGIGELFGVLGSTFKGLRFTYITIIAVVVTAKLMTYSGMTADIAKALVFATGSAYPAFAPVVGALGAFITGSATNTNVLFGPLQTAAAAGLNGVNPAWLAAANSAGAGIGKMLSPQSIALAIGAVGATVQGKESVLMKGIFGYFILYLVIAGAFCYLGQALI